MQKKSLEVLDYYSILEQLKTHTRLDSVKEYIGRLKPISDISELNEQLDHLEQMIYEIENTAVFNINNIYDFSKLIIYLEKNGTLEIFQLLKVLDLLNVVSYLKSFESRVKKPFIKELLERLDENEMLQRQIDRCILSETEIADSASKELFIIRRKKEKKEKEITERINSYLNSKKYQDVLQEEVVTIREGRFVLPVKSSKKSMLRGITHDRSQTGQTLFIEPYPIVELNNELRQLELDEVAEINKIIERLSKEVAQFSKEIYNNQKVIEQFEFLRVKAEFALKNEHNRPILNNEKIIDIKNARHPLIKENCVPIDIKLGGKFNSLIITGPNAGGKTVSLKTTGLLALMAQSGFYIPSDEKSKLNVFDDIFVDIGDNQSIEMSLSTFQASMKNIVHITDNANDNSLVLIDEIAVGTDPIEGAALAISILDYLRKKSILTMATTHYSQIKYYAIEKEDVENASVEFNSETLLPTYKLILGHAGKSNAFIISKRLGLNDKILESAKEILSEDDINVNKLLSNIEEDRIKLETERMNVVKKEEELEKERKLFEKRLKILEDNTQKIIDAAKDKANKILDDSNKTAQNLLKEAKKSKNANTSNIDRTLNNIRHMHKSMKSRYEKEKTLDKKIAKPDLSLKKGDEVVILNLGENATLITNPDKDGNIKVQVGIMKMSTNINNVKKIKTDKTRTNVKRIYNTKKRMHIKTTIDLRGQYLDEALINLEKYLDDASLSGLKEVSIIHGKGTGVLRKGINDYLKDSVYVEDFRHGDDKEGGFGVSVVRLK